MSKISFGEVPLPHKNSNFIKENMSKLSRGLMLPIATLPIAGILLGIGGAITAHTATNSAGYIIGSIINTPGSLIFAILPLIFAIALAINFTKDNGIAGLSATIGYLTFIAIQATLIIVHQDYDAQEPSKFYASFL
jgi:PTS system glucose-specific IIC component